MDEIQVNPLFFNFKKLDNVEECDDFVNEMSTEKDNDAGDDTIIMIDWLFVFYT